VQPYAESWEYPDQQRFADFYAPDARIIHPGFEQPIGTQDLANVYAAESGAGPAAKRRLESWAASGDLLFLQSTATWEAAGRSFELPVAERFTLRDMRAIEAVGYYDLITLAEMKAS
jgi:hypothetical protein